MNEWQEVWDFTKPQAYITIKPGDRIVLHFTNEWGVKRNLQITVKTAVNWGDDILPNWYVEGHLLHNGEPCYWKQRVDKTATLIAVERLQEQC